MLKIASKTLFLAARLITAAVPPWLKSRNGIIRTLTDFPIGTMPMAAPFWRPRWAARRHLSRSLPWILGV
jgi:hypothetical protein